MKTILVNWFYQSSNNLDGIIIGIVVFLVCGIIMYLLKKVSASKKYISRFIHKARNMPNRIKATSIKCFSFDYGNHNGEYILGTYPFRFTTKWTRGDRSAIYAYTDGPDIDAIVRLAAPVRLNEIQLSDIQKLKFHPGERVKTCRIGDAIIWRNREGHYAITKIISIEDHTRGDKNDLLNCEYKIYGGGSHDQL